MFSRMHRFNVNILFNLNKDLIFVNSVSLLHMYRLHHPRYLDKLCKKKKTQIRISLLVAQLLAVQGVPPQIRICYVV